MNKKIAYAGIGILAAVIVIIAAMLQTASGSIASMDNAAVPADTLAILREISNNYTLANNIGMGIVQNLPLTVNRSALLTINGKPAVIYIGADYCPNCAILRWSLILSLYRFGNFSSLHYMTSSATDAAPNSPTFTFFKSSYQSPYITFEGVELFNNKYPYTPLQELNSTESAIFNSFDPNEGTPFVDFGNKTIQLGAEYTPMLIYKSNWSSIINELRVENSTIAQAIIGSANVFTAQICSLINNTAPVCSEKFVRNLE